MTTLPDGWEVVDNASPSLPDGWEVADEPQATTQDPTALSESGAVAEQFNVGLSNLLGLPVDVVSSALRTLGVPIPDQPFGGTDSIQAGMQKAGFINAPGGLTPETTTGQYAGAVARELGASALPFAGMAAFAPKLAASSGAIRQAIGQGYLAAPGATAAGEVASSVGAGLAGEAARDVAPGNTGLEALASVAGGMAPTMAFAPVRAAVRGVGQGPEVASKLDDFAKAGVRPTSADVAERGAARGIRSVLYKVPGGRSRVSREIDRVSKEFQSQATDLIGAREVSAERAGRVIRSGISDEGGFISRFQKTASGLYDSLTTKIDDGLEVDVNRSLETLSDLADPVVGAPNTSAALANAKIREISEAFAQDIVTGPDGVSRLPFGALRAARTKVGSLLASNELIADVPKGQLKRVYGAITEDMGIAADAAGAGREFDRANRFWEAGIKRIDDHLQGITRKVGDEDIFLLATKGKDGASRIRAIRKSLNKNEWNTVSKTILKRMGHLPPGQQDAFGEGFSVERWLTDMNRLSPEAQAAIFDGTPLGRPVRQLQKIAEPIKAGQKFGYNPSDTAHGYAEVALAASAGTAAFAGNVTPALIAGATVISADRAAALMAHPAFVRWLAGSAEISAAQLPGYIGRLSNIGKQNPELVEPLQAYINAIDPGSEDGSDD